MDKKIFIWIFVMISLANITIAFDPPVLNLTFDNLTNVSKDYSPVNSFFDQVGSQQQQSGGGGGGGGGVPLNTSNSTNIETIINTQNKDLTNEEKTILGILGGLAAFIYIRHLRRKK